MKRVLSLDGGGIRGIIPALVLARLEEETGRPAGDLFDLVAGTSTGGILALAVVHPGADGGPGYPASEMVSLYRTEGPRIFRRSLWKLLTSAGGLVEEKYRSDALESVLDSLFGHTPLGRATAPVLVSAYDLAGRRPVFFKSWRARHETLEMRRVARATTAAPTYFEPSRMAVGDGLRSLVDGGVFVNNPAMSAYAEARRLLAADAGSGEGRDDDLLVVSLGTGSQTRPIAHRRARGWGVAEWAVPLLDVVLDGVCDAVDYQLAHLLGRDRFFRFQVELERGRDALDDASAENLRGLEADARRLIETHGERLSRAASLLAADGGG